MIARGEAESIAKEIIVSGSWKFWLLLVLAIGGIILVFSRLPSRQPVTTNGAAPAESSSPEIEDAAVGREMRRLALTASAKTTGATPTKEFTRVWGVLMDWPVGEHIATVFSASTGVASLYTTSTYGIIGGEFHEPVRTAAASFVRAANRYHDAAVPTTEYPYPASDRVRFYLLTFEGGVRVIDTELASVSNHTGRYAELFELGQNVFTELRRVTEKAQ